MINVYLVEYYKRHTNGLNAYVNGLSRMLPLFQGICFHNVWVKASIHKEFQKEIDKSGVVSYYIPWDVADLADNAKNDALVADFLTKEMKDKTNVVCHFNWINHGPFARLLKQKINCKVLLTKHCIPWRDMITINYPAFYEVNKQLLAGTQIKKPIHPLLLREYLSYDAFDHIICVTGFAKQVLEKLFQMPPGKLSVIYNGINHRRQEKSDRTALRSRYGFAHSDKIIFYAGAVNERKGVFDLLAAFEKIADTDSSARLVIAGRIEHSDLLVRVKKHWSKISITGILDKKNIYNFYQIADIGIIPSYIEQCSFTAIEMMHSGLPVVAADVDGLAEIIPDNCGLKVPLILGRKKAHLDQQKLQRNIRFFLDNPAVAGQYAAHALKHARKNLSSDLMAEKTVQAYRRLINETGLVAQADPDRMMESGPLVSILMPCCNGMVYLKECIDSILRQQYSKWELIIIDDGSNDDLDTIINGYGDGRIVCIKNERRSGAATLLNKGIALARGRYIARIDADDMMREDRLMKQVFFLEQNAEYGMVGSNHYVIDITGRPINLMEYPGNDDEIRSFIFFSEIFCATSVMIRTNILRRLKYSGKYKNCEDYHLWFKMVRSSKVFNIQERLTYCRARRQAALARYNMEQEQNALALISDELDRVSLDHTPEELAVHLAIYLKLGVRFFNTPEKIKRLKGWIRKVLEAQKQTGKYPGIDFKRTEGYILKNCCGLENLK